MTNRHLADLNQKQLEAVLYSEGPVAIIAAAGSGKTRVIVHKISYLIDQLNVKPWRILAVTFTNKAAREMKERVIKMIGEPGEATHISTYHSLCARILREEIGYFDYPRNFAILDETDQKQVLNQIYKQLDISIKTLSYGAAINFISWHKTQGILPSTTVDNAKTDTEKLLGRVYKLYTQELARVKALDFDDLLVFVHRLFKAQPEVAHKWANKFDYVLIDEFQDTSLVQYEIIRALIRNDKLTIVGDPDQTIYSWRKADVSLINNFQRHFPGARIVLLEMNYRSTKTILDKANALIKNNTRRIDKSLQATIGEGAPVSFYHGFSDDDEARWIARNITTLHQQGTKLRDIAVLYRANYISASIEKALITANLPYVIWGGASFYQRAEIKDALAFLKVIHNGDEVSLRRVINVPPRKIGSATTDHIYATQARLGVGLWPLLSEQLATLELLPAQRKALGDFVALIKNSQQALAEKKRLASILNRFLVEVGYTTGLSPVSDLTKIENLKELIKILAEWETANPTKTLGDYLEEVALYVNRDQAPTSDYVLLMTVHAAKGLEFDTVFVAGFAESVFPSARAIEDVNNGGLEEERRLAYVAITRARQRLFISDARGFSLDHNFQKKPSRFLMEMGINARDYTSEYIAPLSHDDNYVQQDRQMLPGDQIVHAIFGPGVVVNVQGELVDIVFKGPYGTKTLMKNHKSLQKIGGS